VADLDLRPERRELLVSKVRDSLCTAIPDSQTWLRGSLAAGTADRYSDIDICWVVPDDKFTAAVNSVATALRSVGALASLRVDPDLARSDRRRLMFLRLEGIPLFWRIDVDIRAACMSTDDAYDAARLNARSEAGWSRPASAIENAIAAIKGAARHQADNADRLLVRGYERIGLDPRPVDDLPGRITRLAEMCAALEPDLADRAAEVGEVVDSYTRAKLIPLR
jgi:predicted nucleotidyltransferase